MAFHKLNSGNCVIISKKQKQKQNPPPKNKETKPQPTKQTKTQTHSLTNSLQQKNSISASERFNSTLRNNLSVSATK